MSTPVKPIPDGYLAMTPYLIVRERPARSSFIRRYSVPSSCFAWLTPTARSGMPSS